MATRYTRNTVLLAKVESTAGTDSTPTGSNAMLCSKPQITPIVANNVARDVLRGYMGGSEQLVGTRYVECSFDIELQNGGTAGTRPAFGDLLLACGFAETASVGTRVDYTLVSTGIQSVTLYWYDDGVLHKLLMARGDVEFKMMAGEISVMSFKFKGLYSTPSSASNATPTLTGFKTPLVVAEANTGDLTFNGTHATTGTPSISGGTAYPSLGISMSLGNKVEHTPMLGGESVDLTDRDASCSFTLDLTAAQEVTFMGYVEAATLQRVGIVHGTASGYQALLWLPYTQLINPKKNDRSGKRLIDFEGRVIPSSGNDEVRLVLF